MHENEDINCYVDEDQIRCEIDGREVEMVHEHRELAKDAGTAFTPSSCENVAEEFLRNHRRDSFENFQQRRRLWEISVAGGCPLPVVPEEHRDEERMQQARDRYSVPKPDE